MYDLTALSRSIGLLLFLAFVVPIVIALMSGPVVAVFTRVESALFRIFHRTVVRHRHH